MPSRVNERNCIIAASNPKKKTVTGGSKNLVGDGKENATAKTSASLKCKSKGIAGGGGTVVRGQQGTKQGLSVKSGTSGGVVRSKV